MSNRYPSEVELEQIENWQGDLKSLIEFVQSIYEYEPPKLRIGRDHITRKKCYRLEIHTWGWSGNEDIVASLRKTMFWIMSWEKSERGGHYYFEIDAWAIDKPFDKPGLWASPLFKKKLEQKIDKLILDACCGGRMFWFDKQNPLAYFIDNRELSPEKLSNRATLQVKPDEIMDFRNMSFDDETFYLTVFDPPHLKNNAGDNSFMVKKYGKLPKEWREYLRDGFAECWRVTKTNGVIVFKWNETQVKLKDVIDAIGHDPLFGHTTNTAGNTHWLCFIKTKEG